MVATQGKVSSTLSRWIFLARRRSLGLSKNTSQWSMLISSMLMLASSATSLGGCLSAPSGRRRVRKECTAWPPSCSIVTTSRSELVAFMKMNGTPVSSSG